MKSKSITWVKPRIKYDKTINIKMTLSQYIQLKFIANKLNMTKSDLIRSALTEYCEKHL